MSKKVMVVDDDVHIRLAVRTLLESVDYEVTEAQNGRECLEKLRQGFRGVIILDVMMPEMTGWDTLRHMVNTGLLEGNQVFILTARETPDEPIIGLGSYVVDYIVKPFESDELIATVEGCLAYLA